MINTKHKQISTFSPKSWTIPFAKLLILTSFYIHVYIVKKGLFSNENVTKYFFLVYFAYNETLTKFQIFDQSHGLTPLEKCQFSGFLKPMFSLFRKACLLYQTSKIVFSRFIFTIYYMEIQGPTRGYRGLQGLTRGDRGLQGVTGCYKGL